MIKLSIKELAVIKNTDFLLTKKTVLIKIQKRLAETRIVLNDELVLNDLPFPLKRDQLKGKISKGENYRDLPWIVLDFPAFFSKENIFAYRTFFWWGNFFSSTLHLQGISLDYYRGLITQNISLLLNKGVFICVNQSPWNIIISLKIMFLLPRNITILLAHAGF